jgi:hypothetical protein
VAAPPGAQGAAPQGQNPEMSEIQPNFLVKVLMKLNG